MGGPHFLILGCQKGGTTTLYDLVCRHPRVLPAREKELQFFSLRHEAGLRWYREQFPRRPHCISGEASPYYLFHPLAPGRIAQTFPDVRLIALVRDPVRRSLSHYFHARRLGLESLELDDALRAEPHRLSDAEEILSRGGAHDSHRHHSYVARSRYGSQLERYAERFADDQLLLLRSEDFFADPEGHMVDVWRHLGLDPVRVGVAHRLNRGGGEAAGVAAGTSTRLEQALADERQVTAEWLSRHGRRTPATR